MSVNATVFYKTPVEVSEEERKKVSRQLKKAVKNLTEATPVVIFLSGDAVGHDPGVKVVVTQYSGSGTILSVQEFSV
jgi:hypothetical protein